MRDAVGLDDFAPYAVARWDTVVRAAVLLGVPASAATGLAAEAVALARASPTRTDGALDPDVELFGALVEAHCADRRPWWRWAPTPEDLAARETLTEVEPELDALPPDARVRVVLEAVALLAPEQLDEIVADDGSPAPEGLVGRTAAVANRLEVALLEPGAIPVHRAASRATSRRRLVSVGAVLLAVVLSAVAGLSAASELGTGTPAATRALPLPAPSGSSTASIGTVTSNGRVPVAWFAGGIVRLAARDVPVAGVVSLHVLPDGVVVTTLDRRILLVRDDGEVRPLARLARGTRVATSRVSGFVAYLEPGEPRAVTVYDSVLGDVRARVPVDQQADVVAIDATATYVNDGDGHLVIAGSDEARRTNGVAVLDAAGGVLAISSGPGEVQVLRDGELLLTSEGDDVELSSAGSYALVTPADGAGARQLLEVETGSVVPIALEAELSVTDASFADDGTLVLVARGLNSPPSRDRSDPATTPRRSDLVTCVLTSTAGSAVPTSSCSRNLRLGGASTGPVLAR